jgi:cytosine/adenosine deaminase-related metal-dependent hydrolase
MQMGHGIPVTGRVLALGGKPSIGVDVESSSSASVLLSARLALQVQRCLDNVAVNDRGEEVQGVSIRTRQALEWATIEGARTLGLDHRIGSLGPGKSADIVMVRTDGLGVAPCSEAAGTVLCQSTPSDIDTVLVAGRAVKRNGRLLAADLEQLLARLDEASRRLRAAQAVEGDPAGATAAAVGLS